MMAIENASLVRDILEVRIIGCAGNLCCRALGRDSEAEVDIARAKEIEPGIGP